MDTADNQIALLLVNIHLFWCTLQILSRLQLEWGTCIISKLNKFHHLWWTKPIHILSLLKTYKTHTNFYETLQKPCLQLHKLQKKWRIRNFCVHFLLSHKFVTVKKCKNKICTNVNWIVINMNFHWLSDDNATQISWMSILMKNFLFTIYQ